MRLSVTNSLIIFLSRHLHIKQLRRTHEHVSRDRCSVQSISICVSSSNFPNDSIEVSVCVEALAAEAATCVEGLCEGGVMEVEGSNREEVKLLRDIVALNGRCVMRSTADEGLIHGEGGASDERFTLRAVERDGERERGREALFNTDPT